MKPQLAQILVISVTLNVMGFVIISDQADRLKRQKAHTARVATWGQMMSDIVIDQLKHNPNFTMDPKVKNDLAAYVIMRQNKID